MLSEGWDGAAKGLWIAPIRRFQRGKLVSNENQVEPMTILYPARFGHLVIVRSKPRFLFHSPVRLKPARQELAKSMIQALTHKMNCLTELHKLTNGLL